jgi:hypothetical protein
MSLFDQSCTELLHMTRLSLMSQCRQLHHLSVLFVEALKLVENSRGLAFTLNKEELKLKLKIVELITVYLEAILWFFNAGLIPERLNYDLEQGSAFHAKDLAQLYNSKRTQLKAKICDWLDNDRVTATQRTTFGHTGLLIDRLCTLLGTSLAVRI